MLQALCSSAVQRGRENFLKKSSTPLKTQMPSAESNNLKQTASQFYLFYLALFILFFIEFVGMPVVNKII